MNFKKRVNGSWTNAPHYIHKTSTDTITTLPATLYPTGTTATVGLKGQTVQSSTPSPTSPVMPQGCGDLETVGAKAGQYKTPISSASTTTPVYLGEVETMRRVKKLVLTGKEQWMYEEAYSRFWINIADFTTLGLRLTPFISNAFGSISDGRPLADVPDNTIYSGAIGGVDVHKIFIKCTTYTSLNDWKTYLAAQYAAGTPVTVWYVLEALETGIVNEPLMKIGDYADTLSNVSIPVTAGGDTLSVGTTVQPSEVTVNYKGWHPVQSVHEKSRNLVEGYIANCNIWTDGVLTSDTSFNMFVAKIVQGQEYSLDAPLVCGFFTSKPSIGSVSYNNTRDTSGVYSFVAPIDGYIAFRKASTETTAMLNEGSTALPYEPYWT